MNVYELSPRFERCRSYYRKAYVIEDDNLTMLRSYETIVCTIDHARKVCNVAGRFSNTTARHIREFLRQFDLYDLLPVGTLHACTLKFDRLTI